MKINLKKKPKSKGLSTLKKKAWKLFSLWVRQRDSDHRGYIRCVSCPKEIPWQESHAAHFIPKSRGLVYYFNEKNVHAACPVCNMFQVEMHKINYTVFMEQRYGMGIVRELEALRMIPFKMYREDYETLIETLESKLSVIEKSKKRLEVPV